MHYRQQDYYSQLPGHSGLDLNSSDTYRLTTVNSNTFYLKAGIIQIL